MAETTEQGLDELDRPDLGDDEIDRPEQGVEAVARALSSPLRLRVLRLCAFEARTNKELAELLRVNPGTMLHHVRTLVAAGMLRADEPRTGARGSREVPYRATGLSWNTRVPALSVVILETMRQQLDGVDPEQVDITWLGLRLNADHRAELGRRLNELAVEFKERGPDPDGDPYSLVTVVHPDLNPPGPGSEPATEDSLSVRMGPAEEDGMGFGIADIPDQHGRVAVVTGANGGLGFETARALASKGAQVVLAARDQVKLAGAVEAIRQETSEAGLTTVSLDLGSLQSVRDAAAAVLARHGAVDVLVNNAGVMAVPEGRTVEGFETQLGVDHLGHWALTALLLPALLAAPAARVVTVTSFARFLGRRLDPDNPHLHGRYDAWRAYGQAKLANYHFGLGLQRVFERAGAPASSLIAHPGLAHTELQPTTVRLGGAGGQAHLWAWLAGRFGMSAAEAAMPQLRAATDPGARGGEFYGPRYLTTGPAVRLPVRRPGNTEAIGVLWEVSERETGIALNP